MPASPHVSVIIASHNPDLGRLRRALMALREQTLSAERWETLLVDNASVPGIELTQLSTAVPPNLRIVPEPELGLTAARRCGFQEANGEIFVLVDDDNMLSTDYLEQVLALFAAHPHVGALGGKSLPEFAAQPPAWIEEFFPLLALRNLGAQPILSAGLRPAGAAKNHYPLCAPIGAGMALRRAAARTWLETLEKDPRRTEFDRRGDALVSSGDNDLVLTVMAAGWEVGYFPQLNLTHLIPASRIERDYLVRLHRSMQASWMRVLALHDANPWEPLSPLGARLRKVKAWLKYRPWFSPAACVRYAGACGHFEGRVRK